MGQLELFENQTVKSDYSVVVIILPVQCMIQSTILPLSPELKADEWWINKSTKLMACWVVQEKMTESILSV